MNTLSNFSFKEAHELSERLANQATQALIEEARLTPKPGLVDSRSSGAHEDLTLVLMEKSAHSLTKTFYAMSLSGWGQSVNTSLRREIGRIGRDGEQQMMLATNGVNTHRGSIWAMGLLVTSLAVINDRTTAERVAKLAGDLARLPDSLTGKTFSKGLRACRRYQVPGAREEAQQGFPHIINLSLPMLRSSRLQGAAEQQAQVNALLSIMCSLTDTCLLSRGGMPGLTTVQNGAKAILTAGGIQTPEGQQLFDDLETHMLLKKLSPGGAADLLAATLLLDKTTVIQ